jgi:hypothetical protein
VIARSAGALQNRHDGLGDDSPKWKLPFGSRPGDRPGQESLGLGERDVVDARRQLAFIPEFLSTAYATKRRFYFGSSSIRRQDTHQTNAEMALNYSQVAPAISPVPPDDRRCPRAAGCPARRLSPRAGDKASGMRLRPRFECIALLLQGGGARNAPGHVSSEEESRHEHSEHSGSQARRRRHNRRD